ncbi:hypothetical protein FACS189449_13700 [Alphaproteobacteria bacterium]|nr:hypothetical protein FACS189449_13700 [Alphaproteobacteria bacterium]
MHLRKTGGVSDLSKCIENNLKQKVPNIDQRLILAISDCVAASLTTKSVNSYEWINVLPNICTKKAQESRIRRLLKNKKITVVDFMKNFVREIIDILLKKGETITLIMDQSQILEDRQCLMISIRFENRALPVLWKIVDTKGAIGFDVQEKVLDQLLEMIPLEVEILLAADRFYGTKSFVEWCQKAGWHYRVR